MYEKFPVPLINRLEKHYLGMETMLTEGEGGYGGGEKHYLGMETMLTEGEFGSGL